MRKQPELFWGPGTIALSLAADHQLAVDAGPAKRETWIQISKVGSWAGHSSGPFQLTRAHFESAIAEQKKLATPLNFDYEHASASCIPVHAPSAGYSNKLEIRGEPGSETLWAFTRLTKKAVQEVLDEEYRHISPTWMFDHPDRELGDEAPILASLHSVALTNTPFLDGMEPITLSATMSRLAGIGRLARVALAAKDTMDQMPPPPADGAAAASPEDDVKRVDRLIEALGLPDRAALDAWMEAQAAEAKDAAPPEDKPKGATDAALSLAIAQRDRDGAELDQLRREKAERDVDGLIASGRVLATEREALLDLRLKDADLFVRLTETRKPVVPVGRESRAAKAPVTSPSSAQPETEQERRLAANLKAGGFTTAEISEALIRERGKEASR